MDLSWIGELGRSLVWLLCSCFLQLMDMCYSVLKDLAILNLGDFSFIWQWWKGICVFLTFFILMRVIIQYFKAALDEELIERYDPLTAVKRITIIAFIVMLLPLVMEGFSGLASTATNDIGKIVTGVDIDTKPSSVLLSVGYSDGNNSATKDLDYKNVDINEIDEETGEYKLYPETFDLLFAFVSSAVSCIIFVFVAVQIAQRIVGLLLKILISPFALSGIVDPSDNTFSIWTKLCIADFLTTFFQIVLILLVISVVTMVPLSNPIAKTLFFVGALMAVMNAPAGIAQLLGGDVGVGTAFQQVQSLMMLKTGMQMAGDALSFGAAGATYLTGRGLGGKGLLHGGISAGGTGGGSGMYAGAGGIPMMPPTGGLPGTAGGAFAAPFGAGEANNVSAEGNANGGIETAVASEESRMTKPGTVLGNIADFNAQDRTGSMFNNLASSMYLRSAQRLSRPVQYRTSRGGIAARQSRIVSASNAAHGTINGVGTFTGELSDQMSDPYRR